MMAPSSGAVLRVSAACASRGVFRPGTHVARASAARGVGGDVRASALAVGSSEAVGSASPSEGVFRRERVNLGERMVYVDPSVEHVDVGEFALVCDARSPAEHARDRIVGSISTPVLDDEQHARVGTLYAQEGAYVAQRLGAGLVSGNLARILGSDAFMGLGKGSKVLVYCWRGGERSLSLAHTLSRIGHEVHVVKGGYKAYRRRVMREMERLGRFEYRLVSGPTGCGKGRVLEALRARGAQTVDLESLAEHRGSALGDMGEDGFMAQPSPKLWESRLLDATAGLDEGRPVYVEAESRLIGKRQVPGAMWAQMTRPGVKCVEVSSPLGARVAYTRREYAYFEKPANAGGLKDRLSRLKATRGAEAVARWHAQIDEENWDAFVEDILVNHYDPGYKKSQHRNFGLFCDVYGPRPDGSSDGPSVHPLALQALEQADFDAAAKHIQENLGI